MGRTWWGGRAAAAALSVVVAGCASGTADGDASRLAVSVVAGDTTGAATTRFEGGVAVDAELVESVDPATETPLPEELHIEGAVDFDSGATWIRYEALGEDASEFPPSEMRIIDTSWYWSLDDLSSFPFGIPDDLAGKRWMRIDMDADSDVDTDDPLGTAFIPSPQRLLDDLARSDVDLTIGPEAREIRGTATEHWIAEVDADLAGALNVEPGPGGVALELWVDDDGRVRRLESRGDGDDLWLEFFDFGAPVDVAAPPPDEIVDWDDDDWVSHLEDLYEVAGEWERVANGADAGVTWELWAAPAAAEGATCWSFETDPPLFPDWVADLDLAPSDGGLPEGWSEGDLAPSDGGLPDGWSEPELDQAWRRVEEVTGRVGPDDRLWADDEWDEAAGDALADGDGGWFGYAPVSRDGKGDATCSYRPGHPAAPFDAGRVEPIGYVVGSAPTAEVLVAVAPEGARSVTLQLSDGSTVDLPVDARRGHLVWVGATDHPIREVRLDDGSVACRWAEWPESPPLDPTFEDAPLPLPWTPDEESELRARLRDDGFGPAQIESFVDWWTEPVPDFPSPLGLEEGHLDCWT